MRKRSTLLAAALTLAPVLAAAQAPVAVPAIPMPTIPSTGCPAFPTRLAAPLARVIVDGLCIDLSGFIANVIPGKIWTLNMSSPIALAGGQFQLTGVTFDADPSITFSETTINVTDSENIYAILLSTPIDEGNYTTVTSEGRVSITSGVGGGSVSPVPDAQPTIVSAFGTVGNLGTNLGVDIGTGTCTGGALPGQSTNCDFGMRTNTFTSTFLNNLDVQIVYRQTGLGSVATVTGSVTLNPAGGPATVVPEPATVVLVGSGLLGVVAIGRRRRKVA